MSAPNIFLTNIFSTASKSPSSVRITLKSSPNSSNKLGAKENSANGKIELIGLMTGDPTFSAQNKWGTILNDVSNLTDISSLIGSESLFTWISASTMCWKGTSPLSMGIEFYLINFQQGLRLEEKLRELVKLASLELNSNSRVDSKFRVLAHGGYMADVLSDNQSVLRKYFTASIPSAAGLKDAPEIDASKITGSISVQFGNKSRISNLLLSKIDVTESVIEVAEQNGSSPKPLYYRVNAQFTGVQPLVSTEVDEIFNFGR